MAPYTGMGSDHIFETWISILTDYKAPLPGNDENSNFISIPPGLLLFFNHLKLHLMNPQEKSMTGQPAVDIVSSDPNCTINVTPAGSIPGYSTPSSQNQQDAFDAISQLSIEDIWRLPPFRKDAGTVWLGVMEVLAGGGRTLQIQIDNISGPGTIARVFVQGNLATASTNDRRTYVTQMVCTALKNSLNSAQNQDVNGPCR
jgi:hypothetical protein